MNSTRSIDKLDARAGYANYPPAMGALPEPVTDWLPLGEIVKATGARREAVLFTEMGSAEVRHMVDIGILLKRFSDDFPTKEYRVIHPGVWVHIVSTFRYIDAHARMLD